MKTLLAAAAAIAAVSAALPAAAQDASKTGLYGTLGATHHDLDGANLNTIDGRLGYRVNNWFGVEGEVGFGVGHDNNSAGLNAHINNQEAAYAVGFVPLSPKLDLFGRVGYGRTDEKVSTPTTTFHEDGWRWGGGAQYMFDGANGLRGEFTQNRVNVGADRNDNTWSLSWVRKF